MMERLTYWDNGKPCYKAMQREPLSGEDMDVRPIDANALKKQAYPFPCAIGTELAVPLRALNDAPTLEVAPVVRGEWIKTAPYRPGGRPPRGVVLYQCNLCKGVADTPSNFCPNCGADMRVGNKTAPEGAGEG